MSSMMRSLAWFREAGAMAAGGRFAGIDLLRQQRQEAIVFGLFHNAEKAELLPPTGVEDTGSVQLGGDLRWNGDGAVELLERIGRVDLQQARERRRAGDDQGRSSLAALRAAATSAITSSAEPPHATRRLASRSSNAKRSIFAINRACAGPRSPSLTKDMASSRCSSSSARNGGSLRAR
mgnify:CR=1 FL=1